MLDALKGAVGVGAVLSLLAGAISSFAGYHLPDAGRLLAFGIGAAIGAYLMWPRNRPSEGCGKKWAKPPRLRPKTYTQAQVDAALRILAIETERETIRRCTEVARLYTPSSPSTEGEWHMRKVRDGIAAAIEALEPSTEGEDNG